MDIAKLWGVGHCLITFGSVWLSPLQLSFSLQVQIFVTNIISSSLLQSSHSRTCTHMLSLFSLYSILLSVSGRFLRLFSLYLISLVFPCILSSPYSAALATLWLLLVHTPFHLPASHYGHEAGPDWSALSTCLSLAFHTFSGSLFPYFWNNNFGEFQPYV